MLQKDVQWANDRLAAATLADLLALLTTYIAVLTIVLLICAAEGRAVGERQTSGSDAGSDRGP